jgi:diguanylate cyclase (GGDEF)-like protein
MARPRGLATPASDEQEARSVGQRSTRRVAAVVALLAAVAVPLWLLAAGQPAYRPAGHLPWWVLALLSAAAELFVLHIQVRREAQAISLSEIPLVLGLFLATPVTFGIGRVVGVLLVCVLRRRQAAVKLIFNGVLVLVESAIAVLVFHVALGLVGDGTPARWAAAFAASAAVGALSAICITAVVAIAEQSLDPRDLLREPALGAAASTAVTVGGLMTVVLVEHSSWNALLALLALTALAVGFRAYAVLNERHLALERLYRFSQVVSARPEVDQVLQTILAQATEVLRASHAEVLFLPGGESDPAVRVAAPAGGRLTRTNCLVTGPWARATTAGEPVLITRDTRLPDDRRFLAEESLRDSIIVPLQGAAGLIGALMVADRFGEVRSFDTDDVRLLETVANHASIALRNGQLVDRLAYEAAHDALTGLPNRTTLRRELNDLLQQPDSGRVAVMIMDLDGFKQVNDTLGHHRGDALLQQLAIRLPAAAPPGALVARLGGDEFGIVVADLADPKDAIEIGRGLLRMLAEPVTLDGLTLEVNASIGVTLAPDHADDVATLLRLADMAMYQAKTTLRGVALFDPAANRPDSPAQLALVGELRRAIAEDELRLYVQPKADANTGQVVSVEALVRWQHPEHGMIMPDEFIPIAERNGLIKGLTEVVLRSAITAAVGWERAGMHLPIAVNLSPRGMLDPHLPAEIGLLLAELGSSPSLLTLELTESAMMVDPAGVASLMEELHDMGIRLSIDDFGTGYSSLSSLRKLRLDEIKVDKSFVMGIEENSDDEKIVRSIIDLGTNLGLDVVAEGVENSRIWQMLRRMGCTQIQGYYLTRPIPVSDFPAWLAEYRLRDSTLVTTG